MKGLEISEKFYIEFGKTMLEKKFADILCYIAVGLTGRGSECYGYDDELSKDHDFEPGFCIFLPDESIIDRRTAFLLEREYSKLPKEFLGFKRSVIQPVGGARHGVFRINEYFNEIIGSEDGFLTVSKWLRTPSFTIAEAVNGKIFYDGYGEITKIRNNLSVYPEDIRKKRIAGNLLIMAQSGQYNYKRCVNRAEFGAAQLSVIEFAKSCMSVVFLLNNVYMPYYKWSFRALRELSSFSYFAELLEYLISTGNDKEQKDDFSIPLSEEKYNTIEMMISDIIDELQTQNLTEAVCTDLEKHAYSVNDNIEDSYIRNLNILTAV